MARILALVDRPTAMCLQHEYSDHETLARSPLHSLLQEQV